VVKSPSEYRAEQTGCKVVLSIKEAAEFVKIPINGLSTSQRKIAREPDEIARLLRALRNANLFLQNQREISAGWVEELLEIQRPFAALSYSSSSLTRSHGARRSGRRVVFRGRLKQRKHLRQAPIRRRLKGCGKSPPLMIKRTAPKRLS
jgi:hypothetical protein